MKSHIRQAGNMGFNGCLFELTMNLPVEEAYFKIKEALASKGGKATCEEPPRQLESKHGSLWGITSQSAKKTIKIKLTPQNNSTQISCQTYLASDWLNISLLGCMFAVVFSGTFIWLAVDLDGFLVGLVPSFWSWIIANGAEVNVAAGKALVSLAWGLAVFLIATILVELGVVFFARSKIDSVVFRDFAVIC
jgi:hypothetical protein